MNIEKIIALIDTLVDERINQLPIIQGKRGLRGLKGNTGSDGKDGKDGQDGKSFTWESFKDQILAEVKANAISGPKGDRGLRGYKGRDGLDGKNGIDGKDGASFVWEDHQENISSLIEKHKIRFNDLTEDEKNDLRGERGPRGQRGKQGVQGDKGSDGKSFEWDEHKNIIFDKIEKSKLKFEDFTEEEKYSLRGDRGPRGQRGKPGINGLSAFELWQKENEGSFQDFLKSIRGKDGVPGLKGLDGINGLNGKDGENGKSASEIVDIRLFVLRETFYFRFYFDDGSTIDTNKSDLPSGSSKTNIINDSTLVKALLTTLSEGTEVTSQTKSYNFTGDLVGVSDDGEGNVTVNVSNAEGGIVLNGIDCDASVFLGAAVYIDNSDTAQNAIATNISTSNVLGFVESKSSSVLCDVRVSGRTKENFTGLDVTKDYYLSNINAGEIQTNVPVTTGHVKLRLGQPISSTTFVFLKGEPVIRG